MEELDAEAGDGSTWELLQPTDPASELRAASTKNRDAL
jgi:hypothetical protein